MNSLRKYIRCLFLVIVSGVYCHAQIITTIAGNGITQYIGDGAPATAYSLAGPKSIYADKTGAVYVADFYNNRIRKIYHDTLSTIAGNDTPGYSGDGGAAIAAKLDNPDGICMDTAGNFYITEYYNEAIRKINVHTGVINTICGTGTAGYSGDGGAATGAMLQSPYGGCVDSAGNFYFADYGNHRIRKISAAGIISTVAGTGTAGYSGNNGPATGAELNYPNSVCLDRAGNLYISEYGNNDIRMVDHNSGVIVTVAGSTTAGYTGDGGPATSATLNEPNSVFVDKNGNIYISDYLNNVIRAVSPAGVMHTIAGTGAEGYTGDGGPATNATFRRPTAIFVNDSGYIFVADGNNSVIRKITPLVPFRDGIAQIKMPLCNIFPNPSSGRFTITASNTNDATIAVFNMVGQNIYEAPMTGDKMEIDLTGYSPGMYFVQYLRADEKQVFKLIIR